MQIDQTTWSPELVYADGRWQPGLSIARNETGRFAIVDAERQNVGVKMNRAVVPGLVNSHSHAFQRVIRGLTEYRTSTGGNDSFWTWREMMYRAAARLEPDDIYDVSRMAFLEMALSGITTVGEFHYLHHNPDGIPYNDRNLLAKTVIQAARDVGLRIALLHVAYARAGYETEANPRQARFLQEDPNRFLQDFERLKSDVQAEDATVWTGIAPHSVRAVPLSYLKTICSFASQNELPVHMHVAEQPAEVSACIAEYGRSPVALLETEGLLDGRFTAVHAIHVTDKAVRALAAAQAFVCACPTTERNLGDGVVPADLYLQEGVTVCLGTDSHTQIDLLEDARELEYHLRLQKMRRAVLCEESEGSVDKLAARLFDCATRHGAHSLGSPVSELSLENGGDFFTVDLDDVSIAGAGIDDLLPAIVFSLARTAVKDVFVNGNQIISDGHHANQDEIVQRFVKLQKKLWRDA